MALTVDVELREIAGLREFSEKSRIREKLFQSKGPGITGKAARSFMGGE